MADCIKEVKKALKGRLSDEAIEEIVNDLQATKDLNLKDGASRAQTKVFQRKNEMKKIGLTNLKWFWLHKGDVSN